MDVAALLLRQAGDVPAAMVAGAGATCCRNVAAMLLLVWCLFDAATMNAAMLGLQGAVLLCFHGHATRARSCTQLQPHLRRPRSAAVLLSAIRQCLPARRPPSAFCFGRPLARPRQLHLITISLPLPRSRPPIHPFLSIPHLSAQPCLPSSPPHLVEISGCYLLLTTMAAAISTSAGICSRRAGAWVV